MADRLEVHCLDLIGLHGRTLPKGYQSIRLIHRSAKEFLETDKEAATLLGYDDSTHGERLYNIEKALLLSAYLFATVDKQAPSFPAYLGLDIARFESIQFEMVQLVMSYGIHPNFPTAQSFQALRKAVIFSITPMEAVVSYMLEENLAIENALWILRALIGCGGDLSRPIILSTRVTRYHGSNVVYSSFGPLREHPGLYIEVNLTFALELALWKITRDGVHHPRQRGLADELLPSSIPPLATKPFLSRTARGCANTTAHI
jgi:hypothetical protein